MHAKRPFAPADSQTCVRPRGIGILFGVSEKRQQLEAAIAALEAMRALLGDAVVEAALAPMRRSLLATYSAESGMNPQLKLSQGESARLDERHGVNYAPRQGRPSLVK